MITCTSCGSDVTGKKFCPRCGAAVHPAEPPQLAIQFCPHCNGEVKPGAAFCMHCGASLRAPQVQSASAVPPPPAPSFCPSCNTEVSGTAPFCTNCGQNLRVSPQVALAPASLPCANCGRQNTSDMRFCGGCGSPLGGGAPHVQVDYTQGQYSQPVQPQQYQQAQPSYPQQYQQAQPSYPQQYAQGGYQPQPMMGQSPMVLRCPVCMAMAPIGTPACPSCRTSLAGVVPTPANTMPMQQGQQGGLGGFMQGNGGKYAMGALGGAAALMGGEMLLGGLVNGIENRGGGYDDGGYGGYRHHHRHRDEGLLGGLGELADDIGL